VYEDWTREECGRVYVNWTGNSVVQCMWTGQGRDGQSIFELDREQCGTVYVDWTGKSVVEHM